MHRHAGPVPCHASRMARRALRRRTALRALQTAATRRSVSPVCARGRPPPRLLVCLFVCLSVCLFVRCSPIGLRCVGRTERVGVRVEREKQPAHLSRSGGGSMGASPSIACGLRLAAYGAQYCDETTHWATAASAGEHGTHRGLGCHRSCAVGHEPRCIATQLRTD